MATSVTAGAGAGGSSASQVDRSDRFTRWVRDIRLYSGVVLMVFAATHFLNHALGIAGLQTMEAVQVWRHGFWQSWPGTVLLYGCFIVHPVVGMARIAHRRTLRIPMREAVQIALGLAIPILLIDHIVGTRVVGSLFGLDESYRAVLRRLWPNLAVSQSLLLVIVWVHGVIGLHHTLRTQAWYERWRDIGLAAAVLIPVLGLIGFVVAGREAALLNMPRENYSEALVNTFNMSTMWAKTTFVALIGCFAAYVAVRELLLRAAGRINVRFVGHGNRPIAPGPTLLETSRRFRIPIAAICGGRARCATCRVLVLDGEEHLPAPGANEEKLLRRISAPRHVRLACQLRPKQDIQVQILLPGDSRARAGGRNIIASPQGGEAEVAVLVADLRAFSVLSTCQVPHELVTLLNRFLDEMSQAVGAHNGRIDAFYGDGLMAVFGLQSSARQASRSAIAAAADMLSAVEALNREYAKALPVPIRVGIGIHLGRAIVGSFENTGSGARELIVGDPVSIATQLEAATRRLLADVVVSDDAILASGRQFRGTVQHQVIVSGREQPILVHAFMSIPEAEPGGGPKRTPQPSAAL
jgi:adenylate cyclase